MRLKNCTVLVVGENKLIPGIVICLLEAGHQVWYWDNEETNMPKILDAHFSSGNNDRDKVLQSKNFQTISQLEGLNEIGLVIAVTAENLEQKKETVRTLEKALADNTLIAINTESIPLRQIQQAAKSPERVIGLNWTEPANTTFFLEVISNKANREEAIMELVNIAREDWQKDPYVLNHGQGIRSRMLAALVREAFYLLENDYVKVEDIDRACRNDAGYYLPFAGNCRYMDLMGTYLYGIVMKDLNPELSKATHIPFFFSEMMQKGAKGMENNRGFYSYTEEDTDKITASFVEFSHRIKELMAQYSLEQKNEKVGFFDKNKK